MGISFNLFYEQVIERCGGQEALQDVMPTVRPVDELEILSDDRYLSAMSLRVFRAGIDHSMVNKRWPQFDKAFSGFDPLLLSELSDEELEQRMNAEGVIKHWSKIKSIRENARMVREISERHSGFGRWIAAWPTQDITGLWVELAKRGAMLGGISAPSFLRYIGKDTLLLTADVVQALTDIGLIEGNPSNKKNLAAIQYQFNEWHVETDLPYSHLSRILSMTINQREETAAV